MSKTISSLIFVLLFIAPVGNANDIAKAVAAADAAKGEKLSAVCQACHTVAKGGRKIIGPNLYNVIGRKIASVSDFQYSEGMRKTMGSWDLQTLDRFLANPREMVPGTLMVFSGINNSSDRAALLAWLRLQADTPISLPVLSEQEKANIPTDQGQEDPDMALLPKDAGRQEVYYTCSICHSIKLVVQQGLSRSSWQETLEWMVEEQEMQPLDAKTEKVVLDYLAKHFGIEKK